VSVQARIPVGVVVERRKASSPWTDFVWQPMAVLPGMPDTAPWTVLSHEGDRTQFYAGPAVVEFHTTDTTNYRENLIGDNKLWVVLRPTDAEPGYQLACVTADPFEGEGYTQAGEDVVEPVPMPEQIRAALEAFVAEHHVEEPFFKRKRDRSNPEALGRRGFADEDE
jgi:hypothetical protein